LGLVAALLVVPVINNHVETAPAPDVAIGSKSLLKGLTPVPPLNQIKAAAKDREWSFVSCLNKPVNDCTVRHGKGPHLFLMGDSNAHMYIPMFEQIADQYDLTLSLGTGCPWQKGLTKLGYHTTIERCKSLKADLYSRVIPALQPDTIIVVNAAMGLEDGAPGLVGAVAKAENQLTRPALAELQRSAKHIVIIQPLPYTTNKVGPRACLEHVRFVEQCRFRPGKPTSQLVLLEKIAKTDPAVDIIHTDRMVCPLLTVCDPVIDGKVVWADPQHLTLSFAKTMTDRVTDALALLDVIPGPQS